MSSSTARRHKYTERQLRIRKVIGARLRARRRELGLSQTAVATAIKITYQQYQKYESGLNRVPACKLYELSSVLGIGIAYFFDGIDLDASDHTPGPPYTPGRV